MEHLGDIAKTYYFASSTETREKVDEFIKALDKDGNGEVDYNEFKQSLKDQGYKVYADSALFKELDINGDNGLDHWEVMTLYYIIMSGRPFCTGCDKFIHAEYYVCVECFEQSSDPIYLCPNCFKNRHYKHSHNNKNALFLDTYALLEAQRLSALTKNGGHQVEESPSNTTLTSFRSDQSYSPSSSLAIVPSSITTTGRLAFKAFETALSLANLKVGLLSLGISACTIM